MRFLKSLVFILLLPLFANAQVTTNVADVLAQEYPVAATGSTITVASGNTWLNLTQSGTIATQTVNLPSSPAGGQLFYCSTKGQITQLTLSPTAQGWANGATLGAGQGFILLYSPTTSTWTRIS